MRTAIRWAAAACLTVALAMTVGCASREDSGTATETDAAIQEQQAESAEMQEASDGRDAIRAQIRDEIGDATIFGPNTVRNDTTGNWRYVTVSTLTPTIDYALDYYNGYFDGDNEIHAIVNFGNGTTTRIIPIGGELAVTVFEYQDGEEHDANEMFGGMMLGDYIVNKDTGEVLDLSTVED